MHVQHPRVKTLLANPAVKIVYTRQSILTGNGSLDPTHLVASLVRGGLLRDIVAMYDSERRAAVVVVHLGVEVSGHVGILHGGIMTTLCSEVFAETTRGWQGGGLPVPEPPVATGNLTINFRKPAPAEGYLMCTARATKIQGGAVGLEGHVEDLKSGAHYVHATSSFSADGADVACPPPHLASRL